MKRTASPTDPLEETLENPDLPPLAFVPASRARTARRGLRLMLTLGVFLLVGAFAALRFVSA